MTFKAPVRDLLFTLTEVVGAGELLGDDLDRETLSAILEGAGAFAEEQLAPLNRPGDLAGARFENGRVTAPPGFAEAYKAFAQGGWGALAADPEFGGQGLPKAVELAVYEIVHAANMAFGLCPMLTGGAAEAIRAHGDARQKALYLPRMISGEWTGAMNLTEPQAGSDLGALTTRAEPDGAGGWRLTGQKIFITWGDHDLTRNIVHLVLARLPDAPAGSQGISLFLAPKIGVGEDGALGEPNAVRVGGIEHKLGIHASPTCVMLYEGAHAEMVGEPNRGLAQMFTMMNAARLQVGVEGVGVAERAYQQALGYALERRQGRAVWAAAAPAPIFDHPDVRRTLADMKARIAAGRAICLATAVAADLARVAATEEARQAGRLREEILTPIAKAWSSDMGVEVASLGLQLHGGAGFVEETGAAQHYRDARIAPIYEGTNGIQAMDLVGRKLAMAGGAGLASLVGDMRATCATLVAVPDEQLAAIGHRLSAGVDAVETGSTWLMEHRGGPDVLAGATPCLKLMGDVMGGWLLAKGALAGARSGDEYGQARVAVAGHFADTLLAEAPGRLAAVTAGAARLASLDEAALA